MRTNPLAPRPFAPFGPPSSRGPRADGSFDTLPRADRRAGPRAFSPDALPGQLLRLLPESGVYSDAGATPAPPGQLVQQWNDRSGSGNHFLQATSGSRPTYTTLGGLPVMRFAGKWMAAADFMPTGSGGSYTIAAACRFDSIGNNLFGGSTNRTLWLVNSRPPARHAGANQTPTGLDAPSTNQWYHWVMVYDAARQSARHYLGGTVLAGGRVPTNTDAGAVLGALTTSGTLPMTGYIGDVRVWGRALADADARAVERWGRLKYGGPQFTSLANNKVVIFDGNSLTQGTGASSGNGTVTGTVYPAQTMALLDGTWAGINNGVSGQTTAQMADIAYGKDDWAPNPLRTKTVLVGWEITNDLALGATKEQALANAIAYYSARKAAGHYVIVVTCPPRGTNVQFESDRQWVNAGLRAVYLQCGHALCDIGAHPLIGVPGAQNNGLYYLPDLIHMTDAGYGVVAAEVAPLILAA